MPFKLTIDLPAEPHKDAVELARALLAAGPETVDAKVASAVTALPEAKRPGALALARALAKDATIVTHELLEAVGVKLPELPAPAPKPAPSTSEPVVRADGSLDLSGVPETNRDLVRQAWEAKVEARQAREASDVLRAERDLERAVLLAQTELKHVPLEAGKLGGLLVRSKSALKADDYAELTALLKSVDAIVRESALLKSFGTKRGAESGPQSGADRIEAMVVKAMQESGGKLTRARAYELVLSTDEAAKAVEEDRRAQARPE